jgi:polysaccharide chain length determinant protein (PEP-CTERM system associated)
MKAKKEILLLEHYLKLIIRKRWFLILPLCLALAAAIFLSLKIPPVYEATTLVMVEPQRVPANYVQSIVPPDIQSRISTIAEQIKSRTTLENIISEYGLFSYEQHSNMFMEDKLLSLRKRISVKVSRAQSGNDVFSISFKGPNPERTMKITNTLAADFINENLRVRESQATGTNVFLEGELTSRKYQLEEIEERLEVYRREHMGELPGQLQTNLAILSRLQAEVSDKQKTLRETKNKLSLMKQQTIEVPEFKFAESFLDEGEAGEGGANAKQLRKLKEELQQLQTSYTDRHPDIVKLKEKIARMEEQMEQNLSLNEEESPTGSAKEGEEVELPQIDFKEMKVIRQDEIRADIRTQQAEVAKINRKIRLYQQRIENTPKREQELLSLQRDYNNLKNSYDSLLRRKLEAEVAVNMEKKQKGEQFRIIDYAKLPEKPILPDIPMIFIISVLVGLGAGCGVVYLRDFLDSRIYRVEDLSGLGMPILATIPVIHNDRRKVLKRLNNSATVVILFIALVMSGLLVALSINGVDLTLAFIKKYVAI